MLKVMLFKVAEHSFRAVLLMQFSTCTRISKNVHAVNRAIILFTQHPHYLCYFSGIERMFIDGFSPLLQRYVRKGNDAKKKKKKQQFPAFVFYRKNPVKCNACAVARKIETDCFSRNVPISNDPVFRISRNLANDSLETTGMIYHKKI